eukprot:6141566-Amphidinium_carterae.1
MDVACSYEVWKSTSWGPNPDQKPPQKDNPNHFRNHFPYACPVHMAMGRFSNACVAFSKKVPKRAT